MLKRMSLILALSALLVISACTNDKSVSDDIYDQTDSQDDATTGHKSAEEAEVVVTDDVESDSEETGLEDAITYPVEKDLYYDEYGVWYEIFVRSFADGDGDGIGDFVGLTEKIDYLNDGQPGGYDLGIDGIWLMPINPSPSYHGYDVTDYYDINPQYGTMEEFEAFLDAAHDRGIQVIMDLVVNHSSTQHPWFQEASSSKESEFRDYYTFVGRDDEGYNLDKMVWGHKVFNKVQDEYYYAIFWDQMPDLNFENQKVRDEVIDIAKFWLEKGVDGFRMDAAMHIYGSGEMPAGVDNKAMNLAWWDEFDSALREDYPDYYLVGEVWQDTRARAAYGSVFDTTFNFDLAEFNMVEMVKYGMDLGRQNNGLGIAVEEQLTMFDDVRDGFIDSIYLSNHDQKRVMTAVKGNMAHMKQLAAIYLTLPGNPFIYYGEEIGMTGDKPDEQIREPFIWGEDQVQTSWERLQYNMETESVSEQLMDEASLLNHYRRLIELRKSNPALLQGDFETVETELTKFSAYRRLTEDQTLLVVHNLADKELVISYEELGLKVPEIIYGKEYLSLEVSAGLSIGANGTVVISE